ncbi:MAG TPA: RagB/SusD family nutrient uptake outer membrane protein [Prolixibacteraceae bacterium]|nr:RagB/SusD family nutrient uptake outer membrane protein [Prolixibacteraceae bacterium]
MNKLKLVFFVLLSFIGFFGCDDSFLIKEPSGIPAENYFQNENGIEALLTGAYSMVRGSAMWDVTWGASIQNWTFGSVASDDAYKGAENTDSNPAIPQIERWEVNPENSYVEEKWKWAFGLGIFRTNEILKVIRKSKEISDDKAAKFEAEARYLRALFNFEAWLVFGDYIPIITETTKNPAQVSNINPPDAVLKNIISDLKFAWENLPDKQNEPGRPTKYAAMALAARAYLQDLKYTDAKPLLDNIINSGNFSLMPCFFDNFRIEKENNAESIFEIQANVNDVNESLNGEMGIGLNYPHAGDIGMCCGFHQPSQNLANAFKLDDNGLPLFDTFNDKDLKNDLGIRSEDEFIPTNEWLDPRIDWTLGRRGIPYLDWGIMRGRDWIRKQEDGGPYLPAMKPFFYKSQRYIYSTKTGWMTGVNANNFRYIRFAHVLLWRAEVAASEGDLPKARDLVNMVRQRAGNEVVLGKVKIYRLPKSVYPWGTEGDVDFTQPAANYKIGTYTAFASKEEAMKAVQWEQRLEFATEGMRFFDLRRWDKLPNKIGGKSMAEILNGFAIGDLRTRSFMAGAVFSESDKYMPVPQTQLDFQPGILVQRPEYK